MNAISRQTVRRASRKKAKLRLGLSAPAGAGKTMGALLTAYGLTGDWGKIGLLDTEQGSGELYVDTKVPGTNIVIGEYLYWRVDAPYTIAKYLEGMKELEAAGVEVTILDSISHAWSGAGGLLDKQGKIAAKSGNSYTAWRDVTPEHNAFVEAMLTSPSHIIAAMRSKTEYVLETNEKGRSVPRKVGMAPVQREGLDYEFSVVFEIDQQSHMAAATKDRTAMFDGEFFKLSPEIGRRLREWLERGVDAPHAAPAPGITHQQEPFDTSRSNRMSSAQLDQATNGDQILGFEPPRPDRFVRDRDRLLAKLGEAPSLLDELGHEAALASYNATMANEGVKAVWAKLRAERPELAAEVDRFSAETLERIHAAAAPAKDEEAAA